MFKIFKKKRNDQTTNHLIHLLIEQTLAHKLKKECFQNPDLWEKYNAAKHGMTIDEVKE